MALYDAVFEGGGAKGIAFAGALDALEQQGHGLRRIIGTSAGAITAVLCGTGYTPAEMLEAISERLPDGKPCFSAFMDIPNASGFPESVRQNSTIMKTLHELDTPYIPEPIEKWADDRLLD